MSGDAAERMTIGSVPKCSAAIRHAAILACSYCGNELDVDGDGATCTACGERFPYAAPGMLDMRLSKPKRYALNLELGRPISEQEAETIASACALEADHADIEIPYHLSKELMAWIPRARHPGSMALDLGCGSGLHRDMCERLGFDWIGLDHDSQDAAILGDAHALPFRGESFDLVFSIAVMEHIQHPLVMTHEAFRVLKPGSRFVGTVAFLEPFHGDSYYHHTHLGTINSLRCAGFDLEWLSPVHKWPALIALADMALFPGMPNSLAHAAVFPLHALHRLWWRVAGLARRRSYERQRALATAGAFEFAARKRP